MTAKHKLLFGFLINKKHYLYVALFGISICFAFFRRLFQKVKVIVQCIKMCKRIIIPHRVTQHFPNAS